jgi:cyclophilin family peptidyl-prolyl cis-trans isomerase
MGFVQVKLTDGERKQFYITETGQAHLNEQQTVIQQLLEKLETKREIQTQDELLDIHRAMENLKTSLRLKLHTKSVDAETVRRIAEQIDAAAVAISRL